MNHWTISNGEGLSAMPKGDCEKRKEDMGLCEFYPSEEELEEWGPFCACNSDVSGGPPCIKEDSEACQWAIEERGREKKRK